MPLNHRRSYLIEGVTLVVLGLIAMALPAVAGPGATRALGWLLLVGGAVGLIGTLAARHAPGFVWLLLSASVAMLTGMLLIWDPAAGILSLTLVLILFFLIDGALMITAAIEHRREGAPRWAWMLVGGIVDLVLGGIFLAGMPGTFTWAPSVLVGFDLLVAGGALIAMAVGATSLTRGSSSW
jgi:uncharacterized membrane protein HdeD (DUF308 family)